MDLFELFGLEADAQEEPEKKESAKETKTTTAKPAKAEGASSKKLMKVETPVTVVGDGWSRTVGEGGKMSVADVVKTLITQGLKMAALCSYSLSGNTLFASSIRESASSDDDLIAGGAVTVQLGEVSCDISHTMFDGMDEDELTVYDVTEKFVELHPEFSGCSLRYHAGLSVATPVFSDKASLPKEGSVRIWSEGEIKEYLAGEATALFEGYSFGKSGDLYFPRKELQKGEKSIRLTDEDLSIPKDLHKQAVEKYHLPVQLFLENFGIRKEITSGDFDGKEKITKEDLLDYLKPQFKAFSSPGRNIDIFYDKAHKILGVALISGKKGAAAAVVVPFLGRRIEETAVGDFVGRFSPADGSVQSVLFRMRLPKIPMSFLDTIVKDFRKDLSKEAMLQIYWSEKEKTYYLKRPKQYTGKTGIFYVLSHSADTLVMTVHSHNTMAARFSATDDEDECYTGLFGVIGRLDQDHYECSFRAGMEGAFQPLRMSEIFE